MGAVVCGVGVGLAKDAQAKGRPTGDGRDIALGGLGGMEGGFALMGIFPSSHQEGSTTQWSPERAAPSERTIGAGLSLRF